MSLTSGWLVGAVALLTLAAFVAAVLDRPTPRRRVWRLATRAGRVLALNLLTVTLCALLLNLQFNFYLSWDDLLGPGRTTGTTHSAGAKTTTLPDTAPGPGIGVAVPAHLPALPSPGRRTQTYTVASAGLGTSAEVIVQLPPGYDPKNARTYPVIVGLHGMPAGPQQFIDAGITTALDHAVSAHEIATSIVVIPAISVPTTLDTECVDGGQGQPQADTWLASELPRWVVEHFRVRTDRLSWATIGYSYGAWCGASLALRHPDVFGATVGFEGYFRPDFGTDFRPTASTAGYDLVALAKSAPPPVAVWTLASKQDTLSYPSTTAFLRAARAPTTVTAVVLPTGGHRFDVWQPYVPTALAWLGRTVPGFHA